MNLNRAVTLALRVLTVGLNPSLHEFPAGDPLRRFPLARDSLTANRAPGTPLLCLL